MAPLKRRATYEDILALPEHLTGQIIDGELIVLPRPTFEHGDSAGGAFNELHNAFSRGRGGPGGWWIYSEPEVHLGQDIMVPDLAGWRKEHVPEGLHGAFTEIPPDWVCEVLSPSTAKIDRAKKLPRYARAQVGFVWIIDPTGQTLEVLERDGRKWRLLDVFAGDDRVRAQPFDAIEISLGEWWSTPPSMAR